MDDQAPRALPPTEHDSAVASLDQQYFHPFVTNSSFGLAPECYALLLQEEPRAEHLAPNCRDLVDDFTFSSFDNFCSVQAIQEEPIDFSYEGARVFAGAWMNSKSTIDVGNQQEPGAPPYFAPQANLTSTSNSVTAESLLGERSIAQQNCDTFFVDLSSNDPTVLFTNASSTSFSQKRKRETKSAYINTMDYPQSQNPRHSQDNANGSTNQNSIHHDTESQLQSGSVFAACHLWLSTHSNQHPPEHVISGLAFAFQVPFDKIRQWFRTQLRGVPTNATPPSQPPPELLRNDTPSSVAIAACHIWLSTHLNAMPPEHVIFALSLAFDSPFDSLCNWFRTQLKACCRQPSPMDSSTTFPYRTNQHKCNRNSHADGTATFFTKDSDKPYACTSKCGRNFRTKDDWRKHEEINYPQRIWLCRLPGCAAKSQEKRVKFRKEHFKKHLEFYHSEEPLDENEVAKSCITIDSMFDRECLFHGCTTIFHTWKDRINHIAKHFSTQPWKSSERRTSKDSSREADSGTTTLNMMPRHSIGG
ncbi:hypothetical protein MMC26_004040 [Xylographa opegraphella]|nr:hypothetical protein [Xylographa opegraphella]